MGISNFSNTGGPGHANKITWKPKHRGPGPDRANQGGQPEIIPTNNLQIAGLDLSRISRTIDTGQGVQTVPYSVPKDIGSGIPLGAPVGGRPNALFKGTRTVAKLDSDGKSIKRVG